MRPWSFSRADAAKILKELARLISAQRGDVHRFADAGASKRLEQALKLSRRAMKALAGVNFFDLNNSRPLPPHGIDGVHAEPAVANRPRHY
jgi:hypothetical protein